MGLDQSHSKGFGPRTDLRLFYRYQREMGDTLEAEVNAGVTYIGILDLPDLAATNERRDLVLLPALNGRRVASGEVQVVQRETPHAYPHGHARREVEYQG
jgi:mannose-6-phosphate isomerase class I